MNATPADTLREAASRYVGFAVIACSIVVGELLVRVDELWSRAGASDARSRP